MFEVSIIVPSWHYWKDPTKIQPIYEMHYATVLEDRFGGDNVAVSITDLRGISLDQQPSHVPEKDLYLYWIMKSGDYAEVEFLVRFLRSVYPNSLHVAGGTHIDMCPNESKELFDAIVVGPGEESFSNVIDDIRQGGLKQKIYVTDYKNVHYGSFPYMKRHFLPKTAIVNNRVFDKYGDSIKGTCVLFSRGCNFKCAYCVYNVPGKIQRKPDFMVEEEIEYLKKEYSVEAINLKDEIALPAVKSSCSSFLEAIGRTNIRWRGQTTVWGADKENIRLAAESGCTELAVGIESAQANVREIVAKKLSDKQINDFIENCHINNIKVKLCLIIGLPGEKQSIYEDTLKFIEDTKVDYVAVSGFNPFPGSKIYNNQEYYGIKYVDKDWGKHAHLLYRFDNEENVGLPFEYLPENRWGKTFTKDQIASNIKKIQRYCEERNLTY